MGSVCSEIPELPEIVEGVVAKSEAVTEGNMLEVEMDGNKVSSTYHDLAYNDFTSLNV